MTREQYARGVDTLWNEQCADYATGMAAVEHLGYAHSLAHQQVDDARARNATRGFRVLAEAMANRAGHRFAYPAAYAGWTADVRSDRQPTDTLVTERQSDRWAIEHAADLLLAEAGEPMHGIDVTVRGHLQVKPDQVAYRGQVRYRRPRPCRYHADGTYRGSFVVDADGVAVVPVTEYQTDVIGRGYGWSGHRRIVIGKTGQPVVRKARKARQATTQQARGQATGTRGQAVSWWSMSARSLPRRWAQATPAQQDAASMVEAILRTSQGDVPIELADGHVVIVDRAGACAHRDDPTGRTFPVREYARRAALAGITID